MTKIYHFDLYGSREEKYDFLNTNNWSSIKWKEIDCQPPFYLFIPQNTDLLAEYNLGWKITKIMPINSVGIVTARDSLTIHWSQESVEKTVKDFANLPEEEARIKYNLGKDSQEWKVKFAQEDLRQSGLKNELIVPILYRPFDIRYTYYTGKSRGFICRGRSEVMRNFIGRENLGLITVRQVAEGIFNHSFVTTNILESRITGSNKGIGFIFPLYIYPNTENEQSNLFEQKKANFSEEFLTAITEKIGYLPTPENIFYYIYAVFHSPNYRQRYAEFLKIDFPRIPLTNNDKLFRELVKIGEKLVNLHLNPHPPTPLSQRGRGEYQNKVSFHSEGDNHVTQVKYDAKKQRIYINKESYFANITEEVWRFQIGGYQVLDKWLKDRKKANLELSYQDIIHYQKIVITLQETQQLMLEIDQLIVFPL
jgi:predicted helicase